jgi:hypothetical protein
MNHDITVPTSRFHGEGHFESGCPEREPPLAALIREHGAEGRPDIGPELRRKPDLWKDCMRTVAGLALLVALAGPAAAQQLPLPKHGGCPPGWRESGGHYVAGQDTRTLAVPRTSGPCPAGWITSGQYCTRPAEDRR